MSRQKGQCIKTFCKERQEISQINAFKSFGINSEHKVEFSVTTKDEEQVRKSQTG